MTNRPTGPVVDPLVRRTLRSTSGRPRQSGAVRAKDQWLASRYGFLFDPGQSRARPAVAVELGRRGRGIRTSLQRGRAAERIVRLSDLLGARPWRLTPH